MRIMNGPRAGPSRWGALRSVVQPGEAACGPGPWREDLCAEAEGGSVGRGVPGEWTGQPDREPVRRGPEREAIHWRSGWTHANWG